LKKFQNLKYLKLKIKSNLGVRKLVEEQAFFFSGKFIILYFSL